MQTFSAIFTNALAKQILLLALVLFLALSAIFFSDKREFYSEIGDISGQRLTFNELATYFGNLAREKGGVYAFEVLERADMPPNTDVHLLGHVVGDELYKQKGIEGMTECTRDFRNACSHAIVIGSFLEFGEGTLPKVAEACQQAPGGKGAYTMCFHGFGHGVLAYNSYDFPSTIEFCKQTRTEEYNNQEYVECVGGAVMEIMGGGGHNRDAWLAKRDEYLSPVDPLSLCAASFMPKEARPICYMYLTPHLFVFGGGSLSHPSVKDYQNAFSYCDRIPREQTDERKSCFGGLGKEFVALAQDRDIRKIEVMTDAQLHQVYAWCALAESSEVISICVKEAVGSLYWGGENDRHVAVQFCSLISNTEYQKACVSQLIEEVNRYIDDKEYYRAFCSELPEDYQKTCQTALL